MNKVYSTFIRLFPNVISSAKNLLQYADVTVLLRSANIKARGKFTILSYPKSLRCSLL